MAYHLSSPLHISDSSPIDLTLTNTSTAKTWKVSTDLNDNLIIGTTTMDMLKLEPDTLPEPLGALSTPKLKCVKGVNSVNISADAALSTSYDVVYPTAAPSAGQAMMITGPSSSQFININPLDVAHGGTNSSVALNSNRIMVSNGGAIVETAALTDGQVLVGSTGLAPVASTLTSGTGVSITNGAGSISITNTGVTSLSFGATGLTPNAATTGNIVLGGVLNIANGGTNSSTALNNNRIMVSNGGAIVEAAALTNGQVLVGSTGFAPVASTLTAGSGISITNGAGSITISATGAIGVSSFSAGVTGLTPSIAATGAVVLAGTLVAANGGTGLTTYTIGDILYASGATTLANLSDVAAGNALLSGGVGVAPSYGKVGLTTHVSGILPIANGGTNSSTALNNNRIMVSNGGAIVEAAALTNGQLLVGSTGVAPVAAAITAGTGISVVNGAGTITVASSPVFTTSARTSSIAVANTDTYISAPFSVSAGSISAGMAFKIVVSGSFTGTAAVASNFNIRFGVNGNTSDPSILTAAPTSASATNIPFLLTANITFRTTTTAIASVFIWNQQNASGILNNFRYVINGSAIGGLSTSAAFLGISFLSGSVNNTVTFDQIIVSVA